MRELLSECNPELVKEWSDKNEYGPDKYTAGSNMKVWWKGSCGHEWSASIKNRVYHNSGCPYCSGRKLLKGFNDLESNNAELANEWSDKNGILKPDMVMCQANKAVWWLGGCGHEWRARIADRYKGHGCPYCAGKILKGYNDLASTRPAIMDEWSDKNALDPATVSELSREVVWWKCRDCGHEWQARIYTRCNGGGECPACRKEISRQLYMEYLDRRKKEREDLRELMKRSFIYYLEQTGISFIEDYDPDMGIPIGIYLPDKKVAVEFSTMRDNRRREKAKNAICKKRGFTMIRILEPNVERYDNCYCIRWNEKTLDAVTQVLKKASYIIGDS